MSHRQRPTSGYVSLKFLIRSAVKLKPLYQLIVLGEGGGRRHSKRFMYDNAPDITIAISEVLSDVEHQRKCEMSDRKLRIIHVNLIRFQHVFLNSAWMN